MNRKYCLLAALLVAQPSLAGMIDMDFEFKSRPPLAGVMYVVKDSYSPVTSQVDQLDKKFSAPLFVSTPDNKLLFRNSDSMDHNVYADDKRAGVKFDVGLMQPAAEEEISVNWDEAALVRIGCKIHPKMKAYVANVPSDEFIQLDFSNKVKKRQFVFQVNKPDGVEVKLILPRFNPVSLTLVKGQPQTVELVKGKKVKGSVTLALQ